MRTEISRGIILKIAVLLVCPFFSYSQFSVSGEIMNRSEYRSGYGNLIHKDSLPAVFIGNRTRLQFTYNTRNIKCFVNVQDVRTFGSIPTKVNEPFLSLYEGWTQIRLDSNFRLKIGRQELNYDNSRFFGSADWVLVGRSHDLILLKFENGKIKVDAGYAFNQDGEKLSGNIYTNNYYKTAQLFRGEYKSSNFEIATMFWNEGRQFILLDSVGKIAKQGMRYLQTTGIPTLKLIFGNTSLYTFGYYQFGLESKGKKTEAFDAGVDLSHVVKLNVERKRQLLFGIGGELITGTNKSNLAENRSFSMPYGTNHTLNGYMDHFYVGGRHEKSVGLIDGYCKIKFDLNNKIFCLVNAHYFQSQAHIKKADEVLDPYLGTEIDFTTGIILHDNISFQAGYSQMFASDTFKYLRGMTFVSNTQNWAYLMLLFRPNGKKPFVGIMY